MKILIFLIPVLSLVECITYLRPQNDRGPGTCLKCLTLKEIITWTQIHFEGATKAGVACIEQVERSFFENVYTQQVQNLAVFHSINMTSPASEIEGEYLFGLHERLINPEDGERNFQLRVLRDVADGQDLRNTTFPHITLTDFYVIVADSLRRAINSTKSLSHTPSFNEEAKFLFLVNNPEKRDRGEIIARKLLELMFKQYRAVNVVVLYGTDAYGYNIYTGNPYHGSSGTCGVMTALNIGKCSSGKLSNPSLTKHFLKMDKVPLTMDGCVFNFCARVQEPFVNEGCHDGLEILIMEILQEEMGFRINVTCSKLDRGEPNGDGTWSDLLGEVRDDACDIIAGAFFPDHEVHADFAPTEFYMQDFYTFYVAKAELAPRWKGLIIIFKIWAWTAFGVVLIVSWITWIILGRVSSEAKPHHKVVLTFMNVLSVTLGISANNRPLYSTLRVFFCMLALYALTINAIYTSKLITVFTNPMYDHQIDSVEELIENEIPIGGRLENMDWFENEDEVDREVFRRYNHSNPFRPSTKSLQRVKNGEITIIASKLFVRSNKYRNDVYGISRSMFSNQLEMIVERGFPLLRRINEVISTLRDAGIMHKLFQDFHYNMTILAPIRELKAKGHEAIEDLPQVEFGADDLKSNSDDDSPEVVLTYEHLEGAFTLLYAGLLVSGIVFVLELIVSSEIYKKSMRWIWIKIRCYKKKIIATDREDFKKNQKNNDVIKVKPKEVRNVKWAPVVHYQKFKIHKA